MQWIILAITVTVTGVCVTAKVALLLHYKHMKRIQRRIVEEFAVQPSGEMESTVSLVCNYFHFFITSLVNSLCVHDKKATSPF